MKAKKSLGQHFLRSERALEKIIEAGKLIPGEAILEIGPGQGVLTEKLLACSVQVVAVEKDDQLYEFLKTKFAEEISEEKLILIHDDILDFEPAGYNLKAVTYKLVANIPYNITGAILEKFLSGEHQPTAMVLLVQDEVAKRVVAREDKESILSISVKVYGAPRYVEKVLAGSFVPAPQVDSAILSIENISKKFFNDPSGLISEEKFFTLLKAGFHSKRKKLVSNLGQVVGKERAVEAFRKLSLDQNLRAENVSPELWKEIVHTLS